MRDRWRSSLLTLLVPAALLAPAGLRAATTPPADTMQWQQRQSEGRILLAYEVPDTGNQSLLLACDPAARALSLRYVDDRDRVRGGVAAQVELASEGGKLTLPLQAQQEEMGDQVVLTGAVPLTPVLARILRGTTLLVTLEGESERIPLAGAQPGVEALVAQCGAR